MCELPGLLWWATFYLNTFGLTLEFTQSVFKTTSQYALCFSAHLIQNLVNLDSDVHGFIFHKPPEREKT